MTAQAQKRMAELIEAVRKHALEHYNEDGWDFVVEAMDDEDLADYIGNAYKEAGAIRRLHKIAKDLDDRRQMFRATAW